ncbi:MAG TPA: aldo/keto reductase [Myxococcales bacterium]|nr:aldo/keto reductase [Myxococcales bacterium]
MKRRKLSGVDVPVLGQGTWKMHEKGAAAALRAGIDLGLTHIDTAEMYGTEETVAEAIEGRREEIFLVSKVLPSNASRKGTVRACEQSLRRLRTDRLDCYLLHWPGSHPLEDTIAGFEELCAAGKIRAYGVSNFDEEQVAEAARIAGPGRIACNQVLYNLGERHIEGKVLPRCRELGIALVGYSPIDGLPEGGELEAVARERGATARQVALAFLTRLPDTFTIAKASRVAHVQENAGAASLELTGKQIARLERAYPLRVRRELPTS